MDSCFNINSKNFERFLGPITSSPSTWKSVGPRNDRSWWWGSYKVYEMDACFIFTTKNFERFLGPIAGSPFTWKSVGPRNDRSWWWGSYKVYEMDACFIINTKNFERFLGPITDIPFTWKSPGPRNDRSWWWGSLKSTRRMFVSLSTPKILRDFSARSLAVLSLGNLQGLEMTDHDGRLL
jgi:hypothetical protein